MPDGRRRSREGWADTMEAGPEHPPAHVHRLPPVVRVAIVGVVTAVLLLAVGLGLVAVYVYQANQYVQGRGEFRDAEAARMEAESSERIRQAMCDLLDQLPEGGLLDRPREKYGCGPGIPIDQLSPEEQAQLNGHSRPQVQAPTPAQTPQPPTGSPAVPDPPRGVPVPPPSSPTASPAPEPTAAPAPDGVLDPVTDPLCQALSICL